MNVKQITIVHKMQPVQTILDLTIAHVMIIMKGMDLTVQVRNLYLEYYDIYISIQVETFRNIYTYTHTCIFTSPSPHPPTQKHTQSTQAHSQ